MKYKTLEKKFSYDKLINECKKQGWRLPTLNEAKEIDTLSDVFFLQDASLPPPYNENDIVAMDRCAFNTRSKSLTVRNKNWKLKSVVVVLPKVCINCAHYDGETDHCFKLDKYINRDLVVVIADEWGCTLHEPS